MTIRHRDTLTALLLAGCAGTAFAQAAPEAPRAAQQRQRAPQLDENGDEEIVVNGQKPAGSVEGDIPPEQTLSPADIRAYGVNSISDLLDQLAPQTTSVRGRGSDAPVVLLNGHRISSFAEIRDLPTEAILRAEILPEEVALKYGFSADQKVVNFVLRQRFRAKTAEAGGGSTTEGGGTTANAEAGLYTIQKDNRLSLNGKLQYSDRLLESDRDLAVTNAAGFDTSPYRSLRPRTRTGTLNGVFARPINDVFSGSLNGTITSTDSRSLSGVDATAAHNPLAQRTYGLTEHLGGGANGQLKGWRLSLTGNFDHADSHTRSDVDAGGASPFTNRARSVSNTGNLQLVSNGKLAQLPAGPMSASFKVGGTFTGLDSTSQRLGVTQQVNLSRQAGNGQINIDLPIASKKYGVLSAIGSLTANANIAVNQLSDFGTLRTYGFGLNWTPRAPLSLILSYTDDQGAPTVQQLGNPTLVTPGSRVFDYMRGTTVDVATVSGGNPNLRADDRSVWKLGATWKPLPKSDLTFNVNYVRSKIRDAITTLPEPTADLEAAFPDRFIRDGSGNLIRVDSRPTNISSEDQQTLRWGFNVTLPLNPSKKVVETFRKVVQTRIQQFRAAQAANGQQGPGAPQGQNGAPPPPPDGAPPPDGPPPAGGPGGPGGPGGFGGPPPGGGGFGGGPGGGFGGPPGGGGGFGGGGGRFSERFRQNAGGRLIFTFFHTWTLEDKVLIRPGVPVIDLLDGGSITSSGGQPRHQLDARIGYSNNGIGGQISETWKSGTRVNASAGSTTGDLHFSSLATTDLRVFFNLSQMPQFMAKEWARNLRISFGVTNVFNQRQRVTDAMGTTPIRYIGPYLDPAGRAFTISIRKLFSPNFRPQQRPPQQN